MRRSCKRGEERGVTWGGVGSGLLNQPEECVCVYVIAAPSACCLYAQESLGATPTRCVQGCARHVGSTAWVADGVGHGGGKGGTAG